jgi:large subunit ribosomal protein L22
MAYEATHRFARISARKVRPIADLIRGKLADDALNILKYQPHRGARMLEKVLKSAMANVEHNLKAEGVEAFRVATAHVDGGPMLKRFRPRAQGRAAKIWKRTSHITIVLTDGI